MDELGLAAIAALLADGVRFVGKRLSPWLGASGLLSRGGVKPLPKGQSLILVGFHDFPLAWSFVIDAAEVEDAVDNYPS